MKDDRSSDATAEPAETEDGSLIPVSSATGSPVASEDLDKPEVEPSPARPDALIEGNRVATAEDME